MGLFKKRILKTKLSETTQNHSSSTEENIQSVHIGNQEWMAENLDTDKFRNGDLIPHIESDNEWKEAGRNDQPAWCYYDNDPENGKVYGKLYNWFAIIDPRGLAPKGWHVPTDTEWRILAENCGGEGIAGDKLKEAGTTHWESPNTGATNESGFTARPGGMRFNYGLFEGIGFAGEWRSTTEHGSLNAKGIRITFNRSDCFREYYDNRYGYSVRCVKD